MADWKTATPGATRLRVLARTREVIIADSRGHGRSTRSDKPFGYELMADDYIGLLDYLMIDKVALVGLERRRHHRPRHRDAPSRTPDQALGLWREFQHRRARARFRQGSRLRQAIANAGEDYSRLSPTPTEYDAFVEAISAMWNSQPDYTPQQLGRITAPTMIVDGEYDEAIKREHTEELARLYSERAIADHARRQPFRASAKPRTLQP